MHLEEEMTATIEEKDQYIDVLQTQVNRNIVILK